MYIRNGVNLFSQQLQLLDGLFCFPPDPVIFMVLRLLQAHKKACVILVPAVNAPWVNCTWDKTLRMGVHCFGLLCGKGTEKWCAIVLLMNEFCMLKHGGFLLMDYYFLGSGVKGE